MSTDTSDDTKRRDMRRFLMARRAAISPESVGLPSGWRRRTRGLRREEVAALAGVGLSWYTWLEQGRDIRVSAQTLERIANALRLSRSDTDYLFALAGVARLESAIRPANEVDRSIQDTLDGFQSDPALFLSPWWDVLAYNELADAVFEFDDYDGPFARNHYWRFFMDPKRRAKYLNWDALGEVHVHYLRLLYGQMPGDPHFTQLVEALRSNSPEFCRFWEAQFTAAPSHSFEIGMTLPRVGVVHFMSMRFRALGSQELLILLPPANEVTARAMKNLQQMLNRSAPRKTARARKSNSNPEAVSP
ncbi:helix-turn-helix transcriptional regulator [Chelativorans sp.]|uniref:helix-turn-helix transcriptional regulator n=1 Tax=Chelativorans sp. TaxID=2203393 RepID=UPI002810ECA1|nr:helix-turn-helix transcriptional regulator [Chelativorans sp.]